MAIRLQEDRGTLAEATRSDDGIYEVTLLVEGPGSSGVYTKGAVESGIDVFTPDTLSFFSHAESWDLPNRNVRHEAAGKIIESWVEYENDDTTSTAKLRGKLHIAPEHREFFDFFHEAIALSISAYGNGHEEAGRFIIDELDASDVLASVDVVWRGGVAGAGFDRKLESLKSNAPARERVRESANKFGLFETSATSAEGKEKMNGENMEELKALIEALSAQVKEQDSKIASLIAQKAQEAQAEVDTEALASAAKDAVEAYTAKAAAVEAATLLDIQVAPLLEKAKRGEDITEAITEAEAIAKAALEAAAAPAGERTVTGQIGDASRTIESLIPKGWK